MKIQKHLWLLPLGAVLSALCLMFPKVGVAGWVVMAPALLFLFSVTEGSHRKGAFYLYGFLYFFAFYLAIYHWFLALYPMEFAGISKGEAAMLVVFCWVGLSLLHTLFCALSFPLYAWLARSPLGKKYPLIRPFLFAGVYTVMEWCMTQTFAGVPWARLALGQVETGWLANSVSLFGTYFLAFLIVAVNGLIAHAILYPKRVRLLAGLAAGLFLLNFFCGMIGFLSADVEKGNGVVAAAVQGNIGSSEKWNTQATQKTMEVYEKYTAAAASEGAALVVFPETFLPMSMDEGTPMREYVAELASKYGVTICCGALGYDENGQEYNAVFTVYPDGSVDETVYRKRHLVPFGEYVPMRGFVEKVFPPLADIGMLSDDLAAGTGAEIVETAFGKVGSLICFDSIYETLTIDSVRQGAELIILPTNDSWFTDSVAVVMHNNQARLRAMESNRYFVRSADTGISSVISPRGKMLDTEPPLTEGMVLATVYPNTARTLYSYIGNLFVCLTGSALFLFGAVGVWSVLKKRLPRPLKNLQ